MSSHDHNKEVYFTNPSELAECRKAQNHDNMASRDDMPAYKVYYIESPNPFSKADSENGVYLPSLTTKRENPNESTSQNLPSFLREVPTKDEYLTSMPTENIESNDNESVTLSLSSEESIIEGDLTSMSVKHRNPNVSPPGRTELRPKKPVVQDIYDENNYCLVRGAKFEDWSNNDDNVDSEKMSGCSFSLKKIAITIVAILFVLAIVCGGVAYLVFLKSQGSILLIF